MKDYQNDKFREWEINSTCDQVRIVSTAFETVNFLAIDENTYTGKNITIDQIVMQGSFIVSFTSDHNETRAGLILTWKCQPTGTPV